MKNKIKKFAHLKIYLKYFTSVLSSAACHIFSRKMKNDFRTFNKSDNFCFSYCLIYFFRQKNKQSDWLKVLEIWNSFFLKRCGEQLKPQIYVIEGNLCLFWTKQKKTLFLGQKIAKCCEAKNKIDLFQSFVGQYWR